MRLLFFGHSVEGRTSCPCGHSARAGDARRPHGSHSRPPGHPPRPAGPPRHRRLCACRPACPSLPPHRRPPHPPRRRPGARCSVFGVRSERNDSVKAEGKALARDLPNPFPWVRTGAARRLTASRQREVPPCAPDGCCRYGRKRRTFGSLRAQTPYRQARARPLCQRTFLAANRSPADPAPCPSRPDRRTR